MRKITGVTFLSCVFLVVAAEAEASRVLRGDKEKNKGICVVLRSGESKIVF